MKKPNKTHRRRGDDSRLTQERYDEKLSRTLLESSGEGNSFTDFIHPPQCKRADIVDHYQKNRKEYNAQESSQANCLSYHSINP
ncbi:hypothetical protein PCC7424_0562 [Gloeothece citriformis PCC 7424]|uniref:Uncharacterized protein n=1 Tax=Gloeothece citriformis (strain PCC 7424) TaxID=65393 RepID=B7KEK0_GLOC7|nr:hypothetical protein PCC7424_0562 [Gloeothece citriformis PCC 7424]